LRNDAGDEGGAAKGNGILGACVEPTAAEVESAAEGVVTGTRTACPKRFWFLRCPKHQYMLSQLPQVFFYKQQNLISVPSLEWNQF